MKLERELMRGAAPVAVMKLLSLGEMYGYQLVRQLESRSEGLLKVGQSTLYPMLYNLEAKGLVTSRVDESGPRARKYYKLTDQGLKQLKRDEAQWRVLDKAMQALGVTGGA